MEIFRDAQSTIYLVMCPSNSCTFFILRNMFKVVTLRTFDAFGCEKWEEFDEEWEAIKTQEAFFWKRK